MRGSSLTVVAVLFFGLVFMLVIGCLNPFVRKEYRKMVKDILKTQGHGGGERVHITRSYDGIVYLMTSVFIVVVSTIVHLLVKYPSVKIFFGRDIVDILLSFGVWVILVAIMEILYVLTAFLAETMVMQSMERYYNRLGFRVTWDSRIQ